MTTVGYILVARICEERKKNPYSRLVASVREYSTIIWNEILIAFQYLLYITPLL